MAMKIIFMGTPEFAVPILRAIHESDNKIIEVYTQPATKSGRGQNLIIQMFSIAQNNLI